MRLPHKRQPAARCLLMALSLLFLAWPPPGHCGQQTWKMATLAVDGIGWAKHIREIIFPVVQQATDGNFRVKMYWGGILGDEEQVIERMKTGVLQGGGFTAQGAAIMCPEMNVLSLPFLFNNYEEVDHIRDTMGPQFDRLMQKHGYFMLAWADQDFDQIYSSTIPMNTPTQFARSRILVWAGPMEKALVESLGAEPVEVDVPDVSQAVRDRIADGAIGPAMWVVGAQLQHHVKYINPVKIRYSPSLAVATQKAWNELAPAYQKKLMELRPEVMRRFCVAVRRDNEHFLKAMYQYGMIKVEMDPAHLRLMQRQTRQVWPDLADRLYPQSLLDEILARLEEFRNRPKGP